MSTRKALIATIALLVVMLVVLLAMLPVLFPENPGQLQTPTITQPVPTPTPTTPTTPTIPTEPTSPVETPPADTAPTDPPPTLPAELVFQSGTMLCDDFFVYDCSKDNMMAISCSQQKKLYPASITKLFTAYVALQYLKPEDVITVGAALNMVGYGSSVANLDWGHQLTVAQLIEGMLLPSGNDAAYVLAVAAARAQLGAEKNATDAAKHFVKLMNDHAKELGMTGTNFCNPDGYHNDNHYTTPADLITIAKLALDTEIIRQCAGIAKDTVTFVSGETVEWENTNYLLNPESEFYCPEAIGLKTGKTNRSGYCLLSAFEVEGQFVVIGIFGGEKPDDRFIDTVALFQAVKNSLG